MVVRRRRLGVRRGRWGGRRRRKDVGRGILRVAGKGGSRRRGGGGRRIGVDVLQCEVRGGGRVVEVGFGKRVEVPVGGVCGGGSEREEHAVHVVGVDGGLVKGVEPSENAIVCASLGAV